jgi:hypothetical protein
MSKRPFEDTASRRGTAADGAVSFFAVCRGKDGSGASRGGLLSLYRVAFPVRRIARTGISLSARHDVQLDGWGSIWRRDRPSHAPSDDLIVLDGPRTAQNRRH